ncbi:TATA box-binding protein-associated factor RNA polymerase I subunit B [Trichoplax sp. H2]|nr:TATA box-binding protein-associated factor RNA polymerase I subunit B [Trichoplax sp. H2]|eukprot:RDD44613.1 TATA box-binding protein-associated factor RNA polymerase I subunit B [Trichoplax sp. H2]
MPRCAICDSQSFEVVDGYHYCDLCGTQSQAVFESATGDEGATVLLGRAVSRSRRSLGGMPRKVVDKGVIWYTSEGFTFVIKAQVEQLIKLGADPKLQHVVRQLWFGYLKKIGIAFQESTSKAQQETIRELYRGTNRDVIQVTKDNPIPLKTRKRKRKPAKLDVIDSAFLNSQLTSDDFYPEDDPFNEPTAGSPDKSYISSDSDDDNQNDPQISMPDPSIISGSVSDLFMSGSMPKGKLAMILQMKQCYTIVFCCLGLRWINELILPSDVINWIEDGAVSYLDVSDILPASMKFSSSDHLTFCKQYLPSTTLIENYMKDLARALELPPFPIPDLQLLTGRFILDLQLPPVFHRLVNIIISKCDIFKTNKSSNMVTITFCISTAAMAIVILVVKSIYVLDDNQEHLLAKYSESVADNGNLSDSVWVWEEWINFIEARIFSNATASLPWSLDSLKYFKDWDRYIAYCREKVFGSWKPRVAYNRDRKIINAENIEALLSDSSRHSDDEHLDLDSRKYRSKLSTFPVSGGSNNQNAFKPVRHIPLSKLDVLLSSENEDGFWNYYVQYCSFDEIYKVRPFKNYKKDVVIDQNDAMTFHKSYNLLLNICSRIIKVTPLDLHRRVAYFERYLFSLSGRRW